MYNHNNVTTIQYQSESTLHKTQNNPKTAPPPPNKTQTANIHPIKPKIYQTNQIHINHQ